MAIVQVPHFFQQTNDTCAPACLRMALAFRFGNPKKSEAALARSCCCLPGLGSLVDDAFHTARSNNLNPRWLDNTRIETEMEAALRLLTLLERVAQRETKANLQEVCRCLIKA